MNRGQYIHRNIELLYRSVSSVGVQRGLPLLTVASSLVVILVDPSMKKYDWNCDHPQRRNDQSNNVHGFRCSGVASTTVDVACIPPTTD